MGLEPTHFQVEQSTLDHSMKTSMFEVIESCSLFYYFWFHKLQSPNKIHLAREWVSFATSETCTGYLRLLMPVRSFSLDQSKVCDSFPVRSFQDSYSTHPLFVTRSLGSDRVQRNRTVQTPFRAVVSSCLPTDACRNTVLIPADSLQSLCLLIFWGKVQISERWENVEVYFHHSQ